MSRPSSAAVFSDAARELEERSDHGADSIHESGMCSERRCDRLVACDHACHGVEHARVPVLSQSGACKLEPASAERCGGRRPRGTVAVSTVGAGLSTE